MRHIKFIAVFLLAVLFLPDRTFSAETLTRGSLAYEQLTFRQQKRLQVLYTRAVKVKGNNPRLAFRCLHRALKIHPHHAPSLYLQGRLYVRMGNPEQALAFFRKAYSQTPGDRDIVFWMGMMALRRNDTQAALRYFTETLDIDPLYAPAWFHRGTVYFHVKDWEKSLSDTQQAWKLDESVRAGILTWYQGQAAKGKNEAQRILESLD